MNAFHVNAEQNFSNRLNTILQTPRLRLRQLSVDDTGFIIELLNSPGWLQFIGDRNVKTEEQALAYLNNGPFKSYRENGFGLWLVELKQTQQAIGMCGLLKRDYLKSPDIGFAFLPAFMNSGYAYEIAQATVEYANKELKIPTINGITLPDNVRSIRLLEKIGLHFVETLVPPSSDEVLQVYST